MASPYCGYSINIAYVERGGWSQGEMTFETKLALWCQFIAGDIIFWGVNKIKHFFVTKI